jgi:superfamily II DNA or RNA helicase
MRTIPQDEQRVIVATGRYAGEGFDDARLDTLFLAMPISWRGTLQQYVGRLHRARAGKHEVRVYDYVDRNMPVLARMFAKRLKGYRAMGYLTENEEDPVPEDMCAQVNNVRANFGDSETVFP